MYVASVTQRTEDLVSQNRLIVALLESRGIFVDPSELVGTTRAAQALTKQKITEDPLEHTRMKDEALVAASLLSMPQTCFGDGSKDGSAPDSIASPAQEPIAGVALPPPRSDSLSGRLKPLASQFVLH